MDVLFILEFFPALADFPIHFVQAGVQMAYAYDYISASN